jgi:hypothetical protein
MANHSWQHEFGCICFERMPPEIFTAPNGEIRKRWGAAEECPRHGVGTDYHHKYERDAKGKGR